MMIKYSIGGQITSIVEDDVVQEKEVNTATTPFDKIAVCNNCGIQHLVKEEYNCTCECGNTIRLN